MRETVDTYTNASVENLVKRLLEYASRPLSDFNKYDALSMCDTLQQTAHDKTHTKENYYKLVFQTLRTKTDLPSLQFQNVLLRLVGDKDHQRIIDIVAKADKQFARSNLQQNDVRFTPMGRRQRPSSSVLKCFYCQQPGHIRSQCFKRRRDLAATRQHQDPPTPSKGP